MQGRQTGHTGEASGGLTVAVIGAGVAGLAAALALRRRAGLVDVAVYERDATDILPRRVGHGLLLMQNGVRALDALGARSLLDGYRPLNAAVLQTEGGIVVRREPLDNVYCVTRAGLVEGLRRGLPPGVVRYGAGARRIELTPRSASSPPRIAAVELDDGTVLAGQREPRPGEPPRAGNGRGFDLLVGADGYRSGLCTALNPGFERAESRVLEIVTSTDLPELAARLGSRFIKTIFPSRGLAFGLLAPTATRVIGFLQFDRERYEPPADPSPAALVGLLRALLADAPEPIKGYLAEVEVPSAHLWRPINSDLPPVLSGDNAVLSGDAAHPLVPFTSQGVAAALEDAVMLADALSGLVDDCRVLNGSVARLLPGVLRGFAADRRRDLAPFIAGGRRILQNFIEPASVVATPYLDGAVSRLDEHLCLPRGGLLDLFRVLDVDANGGLDIAEFARLTALLGLAIDGAALRELFEQIDDDGNGLLAFAEIAEAFGGTGPVSPALEAVRSQVSPRRLERSTIEQRAQNLLRQLDADGDGRIDFDEFTSGLLLLGSPLGLDEARRIFDGLDRNHDGRLDVDDLVAAFVARAPAPAAPDRSGAEHDPLFADEAVRLPTLRQRAFNYRWATLPPDVIPLTAADLDFPVAGVITDAVRRYLEGGYLSYGPAEGLPLLREVAAAHLAATRGVPATASRVFVTDSAASGLFLAARVAVIEPGDEVLVPDPVDFLFERSVLAAGGRVVRYPLHAGRHHAPDPAEVEALVSPRTRMLSICNPHNPLGRVWRRDELMALADIAVRRDLWIMSDEVWAEIVHAPHALTATASLGPEVARRTLSIYGFSKGYGLAGLRVGLFVSPDDATHERVVTLAHARDTAYGVSTLSQVAAAAAYQHAGPWLDRFRAHLLRQRDHALARIAQIPGLRCHTPEGTFVVFPDVTATGLEVDALVAHLREAHGLAVVPGSPAFFGPRAAGHIRLSYATSRRILDEGLDRLDAGVRSARSRPPTGIGR